MTDLSGKVVLITGASSGIGAACVEAFAAVGARVACCARRLEPMQALAARLREGHGAEVHPFALDVRDREAVEASLATLPASHSEVEILVNNAGLSRGLEPLYRGEPTDWEEMLDTNVKGLLWVTRALLPGMVARGRGQIVNLGSIAGHEVYPGGNVYCASKHAVDALTRSLRLDLLGTGVRVSTVDPGLVDTGFSTVRFHGDRSRADATYRGMEPLRAPDVAEAVLWVTSRPPHVNAAEVLILPSAQASATAVHRDPSPRG